MHAHEKVGGIPKDERRMEMLRDTLDAYGLVDIEYSERWFTLERGNLPTTNISEWLEMGWLV